MSQMETFKSDKYEDGRTKQSFIDQTDINKIMVKANRGDTISHMAKHGAIYGDFSDIDDLLTAYQKLERGNQIFQELPGETRREFNNSSAEFFKFVNNPENAQRLPEVLPQLAQRGNQRRVDVRRTLENQQQSTTEETGDPPSGAE